LKEFGIKGELFSGKAQWTVAGFQQERTDVTTPSDPSLSAFASSTATKGIESSFNWQPIKSLTTGASLTFMQPKFTTPLTLANTQNINARLLGFQDIVLPTGEVFPAEAFGYAGNMSVVLADRDNTYDDVPGIPKWQASANASYSIGKGFGLLVNGQYVSQVWADRLKTELLPDSIVWNAGATWDHKRVHLKVNVYNLTNELQFRSGIFGAPNLASVLPLRRYEATLKMEF
jgi:outer membrane receptor protein involved in Fe transport